MFALPYLSGTEFVRMLARFGYRPHSRSGGVAALKREANVVIVPEASTLSPTLVRAILRTANIDPHEFLRLFISMPIPTALSTNTLPRHDRDDEAGPPSKQVA